MTTEAFPDAPRRRLRVLRLSAWVLGTAALVWGGVAIWRAQPAVRVSAQAAKVTAAPEPLEEVALRALRARFRDPGGTYFREVRVYEFGPPDERSVCGFVASREASGPPGGAEFVVRVILPGGGRTGGAPLPVLEEGPTLPRATANARRRYCRNADDPHTAPPAPAGTVLSTATTTTVAPDPRTGGNAQPSGAQAGGPGAVLKRVAVAGGNAANLRNSPGGGSAVIAVLPRGQVLDLFERAPGGWMRVGVGEPWGWVHSSLVVEGP